MKCTSIMINSKTNILNWIKAVRAPFLTATVIPIILGSVAAWHDTSSFLWGRFWLALIGGCLMHAGTNLINDYFDHLSGCDEANKTPTPFSGGSRVIQENLIPPAHVLYASLALFATGSAIGLYLNYKCGGNAILILGVIGLLLGFFYTVKRARIVYGGVGEAAVGLGFGPIMVMGAYYVQAQSLSLKAFLISIPVGILIALVLFINEFPDYAGDISVGKKTLVVILGRKRAVILYNILLAVTYLSILALAALKFMPIWALISLLTVPLALKAFSVSRNNYEKVFELMPANAATIGLHFLIGILLAFGFVMDKLLV